MSKIITAALFSLFIASATYYFKTFLLTGRKRIQLVKEATEKNHIIKGKLIKTKTVRRESPVGSNHYELCDLGIYEYQYKDKTFKTKVYNSVGPLPNEIDLFYVKNPKKATSEYSLGQTEISWLKYFIITFIIVYILCLIIK